MHQFVRLGKELIPGTREILSSHTWRLMPKKFEGSGEFVQVTGKYCGIRNVAADYCYNNAGEFVMRSAILKKVRSDRRQIRAPKGLVWGATTFGYGDSFSWFNHSTVKELLRQGAPVKVLMWGGGNPEHGFPRASWEKDYQDSIAILNVRRRAPSEMFQKVERGALCLMGYFQCEGTKVAPHLLDYFRHFDVLLATSEATKAAFANSGLAIPSFVFGHGIDADQYPYLDRPLGKRPYTFFHFADVQARKGTDVLVKAFKALKRTDVRLYIKAQWENPESKEYRKELANDSRVTWDFKRYAPSEMAALMSNMDCGVFPSRAEGFGIPKIECEATGMPTIATDAFGYRDTSTPDGTILLKVKSWVPTHIDAGEQAEPDVDHLVALLNQCANDPAWAKERGRAASDNIHSHWKWSDKIGELLDFLKTYGLTMESMKQPAL